MALVVIAGVAGLARAGVASGEATPGVWEPPSGAVFAANEGDGPAPDDPRLRVGDVVARGIFGADGECVPPPGGVGAGFSPPDGYEMSVHIEALPERCEWVISAIELTGSQGDQPTPLPTDCPDGCGQIGLDGEGVVIEPTSTAP